MSSLVERTSTREKSDHNPGLVAATLQIISGRPKTTAVAVGVALTAVVAYRYQDTIRRFWRARTAGND